VTNPRFQQWAAALPLTRPVARRHAAALFDLCAGFVYSQTLLACVRLQLCETLRAGPQSVEQLAGRLSLPVDGAARLLCAAAGLRLAERRRDGRFGLGMLGAALLGNPGVAALIQHHALLYDDLRDPVGLLRGEPGNTRLRRYWPYADAASPTALESAAVAAYSDLMAVSQPLVAADILAAYRFSQHRCLLDLGGGDGSFLTAVAAAVPSLQLVLFDLPAVAERARCRFAESGLATRAVAIDGDFRHDPLPNGADLISLIRVIHDHDDTDALAILRAARRALPPGGRLLLAEPMAGTAGAQPVGAYFSFYLLAMGSGRPREAAELATLLGQAGFVRVRALSTRRPMLVRLLVADVPVSIGV
jgi:demethylspheroidene O-methyltransferase